MKIIFCVLGIYLSLLFGTSCSKSGSKNECEQRSNFNGSNFPDFREPNNGLSNLRDTLKIAVHFNDCGEFGGHYESIYIYNIEDKGLVARLIQDSVSCADLPLIETPQDPNFDLHRHVILDTLKLIKPIDEKLINLFIHRIIELQINNKEYYDPLDKHPSFHVFSRSGVFINIWNTNSSLDISYFNYDCHANTWFGKITNMIFGLDGYKKKNYWREKLGY